MADEFQTQPFPRKQPQQNKKNEPPRVGEKLLLHKNPLQPQPQPMNDILPFKSTYFFLLHVPRLAALAPPRMDEWNLMYVYIHAANPSIYLEVSVVFGFSSIRRIRSSLNMRLSGIPVDWQNSTTFNGPLPPLQEEACWCCRIICKKVKVKKKYTRLLMSKYGCQ